MCIPRHREYANSGVNGLTPTYAIKKGVRYGYYISAARHFSFAARRSAAMLLHSYLCHPSDAPAAEMPDIFMTGQDSPNVRQSAAQS
jgi:hypothetical protein